MSNISRTNLDSKAMLEQFMAKKRKQQVGTRSGRGRLIFALDATHSRAGTWDLASKLQADMLRSVASDTLDLKVMFFRGTECEKTEWTADSGKLARSMSRIECVTGSTQIEKILEHALAEDHVDAVVYVGDAVEEPLDGLSHLAGLLGDAEVPCFMFLEGTAGDGDPVEAAFRLIAKQSGGAFFRFGIDSPQAVTQFADTLKTIADAVTKVAIGDSGAIAAITHKKGE